LAGCRDRFPFDDRRILLLARQIVEEGPVVNHGAAKILSAGLSPRLADCDLVGRAVVLRHDWVFDRDVCCTLLEISNWISASGHQIADQLVGLSDSPRRCIDKVSLHAVPLLGKSRSIFGGQRTNVKLLHALRALFEPGFGNTLIASLGNGAIILGTKMLAELFRAALLQNCKCDGADHDHNDGYDDGDLCGGKRLKIHNPESSCLLSSRYGLNRVCFGESLARRERAARTPAQPFQFESLFEEEVAS